MIIRHAELKAGDACPECARGKVYAQRDPKVLVKIVGQAPLAATVYEMERLRCNGCGQVFTAAEPEGIDSEKYDACQGRSKSFPPRRRKRGPLLSRGGRFVSEFGGGWSVALRRPLGRRV